MFCILQEQAGDVDDAKIETAEKSPAQQNVEFSDQVTPYATDMSGVHDPTRRLQDTNDATLENFFSRPIKIFDAQWLVNQSFFQDFDPWSLYFQNPRVINRLSNFNIMRANLHLRFIINGNGFYYGRLLASYLPYESVDRLTKNRFNFSADLVGASQRPHLYLDPTTSQGGELKVPLFLTTNYLSVPSSQWGELGQMNIRSINNLKHANAATEAITVSVFAWATDVNMNVLTSVDSDTLVPQAGELEEANSKGFISGPASVVAKIAGAFTAVPMLRPFAMATSIAAGAVGEVAKLFGYCRPTITKAPDPFVPRPFGYMAVTNEPDNVFKLTLDRAQELTIDTRIFGLEGKDPLNIQQIAARESYLTTFQWTLGTAPETLLFNMRVDPVVWNESTEGNFTGIHLPACAMAALPFDKWTGKMKVRMQIVSSEFHKGRLAFRYDPNFQASSEYNVNYIHIVDIAETRDFTLEIGNGQNRTLLSHHKPGVNSVTEVFSTTAYSAPGPGNGVLSVSVVNELTVPNNTVNNDIQINVFVSAGDDFEVFIPDNFYQSLVISNPTNEPELELEPQAGEIPEASNTAEPSAPMQKSAVQLGPGTQSTEYINAVYTGEAIKSMRQWMKRYVLHHCTAILSSSQSVHTHTACIYPFYRGYQPAAVHVTAGGNQYNYCNVTPLQWVTMCHSGWRGSIRYKMVLRSKNASALEAFGDHRIDVERVRKTDSYTSNTSPAPQWPNQSSAASSLVHQEEVSPPSVGFEKVITGANGEAVTISGVNGAMEFEIPFYSDLRFVPGKPNVYTQDYPIGGFVSKVYTGSDQRTAVDYYVSAGEDYQVAFWTGMPILRYEPTPPAPLP